MKERDMQQFIDILMAIIAFGMVTFVMAFCARFGWEVGSKLI